MHFADNRNKIGKYIPAVVFLIFIYGMALWFIFSPKPDYSSSEKDTYRSFRRLQPKNCFRVISAVSLKHSLPIGFRRETHGWVLTHTPPLRRVTTVQAVCITAKTATLSTSLFQLRTTSTRISVRLRILQINRHSDNGYARSVNRIYC